jgi:hypothetical protein
LDHTLIYRLLMCPFNPSTMCVVSQSGHVFRSASLIEMTEITLLNLRDGGVGLRMMPRVHYWWMIQTANCAAEDFLEYNI